MATATSLTSGDVIKKANVTPKGIPPFTNPMNRGMDEHEQNGVIAPNSDASKYCNPYILCVTRYFLKRSIGK